MNPYSDRSDALLTPLTQPLGDNFVSSVAEGQLMKVCDFCVNFDMLTTWVKVQGGRDGMRQALIIQT